MGLEEELSDETIDVLERIGHRIRIHLDETQRKRYFLSEGTGMELWWMLKARYFTPERLERCKNELKRKELLAVERYEGLPKYYKRFRAGLALKPKVKDMNDYSRGHVDIWYDDERTRLKFEEEAIERYRNNGLERRFEKLVEEGLEYYNFMRESPDESFEDLQEKGILKRSLEKDEDEIETVIQEMEKEGLLTVEEEVKEKHKPETFISEWVEEGDRKTRFFFSPELYMEFLE